MREFAGVQFQPAGKSLRKATLYSALRRRSARRWTVRVLRLPPEGFLLLRRCVLSAGGLPAAPAVRLPSMWQFAGFPCHFACCFLSFCDFSPAQARKMRLFLCKREGVFGSRRQCPRDRAPLSCESPRVLNVGVSKIGKTMQINEAGIMGSTCPPYTNKKRRRIFPYGVSADGVCFCTVCCPPCPPCPPVRCCPPVRQCSFLICIWAFLI